MPGPWSVIDTSTYPSSVARMLMLSVRCEGGVEVIASSLPVSPRVIRYRLDRAE